MPFPFKKYLWYARPGAVIHLLSELAFTNFSNHPKIQKKIEIGRESMGSRDGGVVWY
jgi:hypothetical protein